MFWYLFSNPVKQKLFIRMHLMGLQHNIMPHDINIVDLQISI